MKPQVQLQVLDKEDFDAVASKLRDLKEKDPDGAAALGKQLRAFAEVLTDDDGNIICSGFNVLAPLFGVSNRDPNRSNPNKRDRLRVTGPVESGIGGGYYQSFSPGTCKSGGDGQQWIANWEVFAFSEGLNPATKFQIGIGGGVGITVVGKFQLGIGLGYDLIRRETIDYGGVARTYSNGLLIWNDVTGCGTRSDGDGSRWACAGRNFTWLITFGLTSGTE